MKIVTIIGARPQFVKAAIVSRAFKLHRQDVKEIIVHTGQHYDSNMSDIFFDELEIPKPDYNLGIGGGTHGQNTGRMIEAIENLLLKIHPEWVLVYGDTDSTFAGALAAAKLHIPVAHVEAGLRSHNRRMPEEVNRVLTDHVSSVLFTPTDNATQNLKKEGVNSDRIIQVGDVMYDAALFYEKNAQIPEDFNLSHNFILSTIHRAENTDDPKRLIQIVKALNEISSTIPVVLPLHPRTKNITDSLGLDLSNIHVLNPVGYLEMVWLLKHCKLVISDSGGLQKEAYFFGKKCVITRDETEWVELVEMGANVLVGTNSNKIVYESLELTINTNKKVGLYGQGDASERISKALLTF